jgi:two-component sensor histidine kinase
VKNNLQLISSLLTLAIKEVKDRLALERLEALKARVMNLGAIHNLLYLDDASSVDAASFVEALSHEIRTAYAMRNVDLSMDVEPVRLDIGRTIPLGLLLNEALLNAFKHAFASQENPSVEITLRRNGDGQLRLAVADNGSGYKTARPGSSGMRLMAAFASQLGGRLDVNGGNGTLVEVEFPATRQ